MHRGGKTTRLAVVAVLVAVAGCAGQGDDGPEPPAGGDALVLRLTDLPGLLPPGGAAALSPSFSLFGDGRLISAPAGPADHWPRLREDRVPRDDVRDLLRRAVALPDGSTGGHPDGPVTRVVVGTTSGPRTVTVDRADPALTRLRTSLAGYADGPPVPYEPTAVAVIATPVDSPAPARPWPLPTLTGEPLGGTSAGSTCLVLRGADLDTVQRQAATAGAATPWRGGDRLWQVTPRPLLPDEAGCADL
ncbi:hypothetical protein ACFOOK_17505 [Micromonospora krabiensis]|uniref:Sporulation and spore germination n=1 Tax=Micromonospora krabiensis TaxID=307121 RepID=A0A1C3MZI7_9ACTN|nr:hypothetical protein [Micromonospora krabiensis]SBV25757.1 hypothetical protein GA0070620_1237 [Micromonospora krabiensis]